MSTSQTITGQNGKEKNFLPHSADFKEYHTIGEVSSLLDVPTHVLRFWETRFPHIAPVKRKGGRRYYRSGDIEALQEVKHLLYQEGYSIRGAKKAIHSQKSSTDDPVEEYKENLALCIRELEIYRDMLREYGRDV